jgi:geranylgeranyl diphosphate synthase type II
MIKLKTSVLLAGSLKIGAILGNANAEDANNLYNFGVNIGLAFQLQDDILDVFGDTAKFGKNIGGDISSNKKTFLLLKALELASFEKRKELTEWINLKEFDKSAKIKAVTSIYNNLKVREFAEDLKNEYFEKSILNIENIKIPENKKTHLRNISKKLLNREY